MIIATSLLLFVVAAQPVALPAGTELQVRLTTEVSSDKPSGQPVSGVVIVPVFADGVPRIGAGVHLSGNTADASPFKAATDQAAEQAATVRIQFTKIEDESGHSKPLFCILEAVDNARESVDSSGLVAGVAPSQTFEAKLDQAIDKLESRYQEFAQILSGIKSAFVKQVDPSIDYKPGVEVKLKLTKALEWSASSVTNLPAAIEQADTLVNLVNSEPFRTVAQKPPSPSDITNLMFIGTSEQIQAAFQEAQWSGANQLSESSKIETARALIENRGYSEAPMSVLYLDGRPPDLAFEKQNDTFAMRHHIRIWMRPRTFHGKPVWVAAATHDISITFSPVSKSFTHGIDSHIDKERSKVVNDLLFTGHVHGLALVDRQGMPQDASNATGDKLSTDCRMAVLEF